jgi:hypothetical protein
MQVNSAQDYLTLKKRQVVAATYYTTPPPQSRKYNYVYTSVEANGATQFQKVNTINTSAWGSAAGGVSFISWCTSNCSRSLGAPGTFQIVNTPGSLRVRDLNLAMSYKATV